MSETIAFYGAGMLGSGFVQAFSRRGVRVRVWNRTFARAKALERYGAVAFENAAEAASGAQRVHLCLRDGDAVDAVLAAAAGEIARGTFVLDHTTVAPGGISARERRLDALGLPFLHAPVFMGPPNAADATGLMLVSGDAQRFERVRAALEPMTGRVWYLGGRIDKAAVFKLMGNAMILAVVGGLNDVFAIAERSGIDRREAYTLFDHYNPSGQIGGRGKRMAAEDYDPTWTLETAHKDAALMIEAAQGFPLPVIAAVEAELRAAIDRGLSDRDLAALARR